jgi:NAD(P)-dependent dehydrogenase (short-subunit alcohol dehydrogenase family)
MAGSLDGRVALVTGAARGIGRAIAEHMAAAGARVIATDVDADAAADLARAIAGRGGECVGRRHDVSDRASCEKLAASVDGPVSILVNNAGIIFPGRIHEERAANNWDWTLEVNITGAFNMARAFYPQLKASGGTLINLASIRSFVAAGDAAAYAATKGAVMQLTKALAVEWGPEGVRVNAIAPGFIDTRLVPDGLKTPARLAAIIARTPLRRQGQPEEVAEAAVFLASNAARFISGAILAVDGGYLAG